MTRDYYSLGTLKAERKLKLNPTKNPLIFFAKFNYIVREAFLTALAGKNNIVKLPNCQQPLQNEYRSTNESPGIKDAKIKEKAALCRI